MVHQPGSEPDRHQPDLQPQHEPYSITGPESVRRRPRRPKATTAAWVAVAIALVEVVLRIFER